jgi:glycosyltransferase involved in cell wall biosynthesis
LRWKQAVVLLIGFFMIVTPWILRNKQVFNQYAITYRTGIVIYTRSLKAQIPWSQIGTSYGSVLAGQATMLHLFPSAPPVTIQLWDQTWEAKNALMAQGMRFYQADAVLLSRAAQTIFSSPEVFAKYILWSGVDELRFFEMTSPFSPKFGVEWIANDVAKAGRLSGAQLAIVLAAHALQLAWWVLIACGFIVLIRKRMWQHPSVLLIGYAAIMYAPFDNIPRYAVPVLPWIIALIVMAIIPSVFAGKKRGSVLMLAESTNPKNGWGVYARGLADALKAEGVSITMLTSDANSEGMRLPSVHASRWRWVCATIWLRTWLLLNPHRLIHVVAEPYGRLFRGFGQTPFLLTIHGTYADPAAQGPAWAVKAYTEALRQSSGLVTVSSYTKEQLPESVRQKAVVIPNGVDASIVTESFESATRHSAPLILSVGAIKPRKGFDRLMTGFAQFQKTHPDAELVIVGRVDRPDVRDTLLRHADSLGIADHVRLTGEVTRAELLGWYRACDVFALTPVNDGGFEGFGLVYLEANLFGKPAVGSRNSGAVDAIQEGKNGYLVDPERPEDIMRALDNAMTLQADQIQQTTQQKTWRSVAQAFRKLYDR